MSDRFLISRLLLSAGLFCAVARGESPTVAKALGLKGSAAKAVESGAQQAWDRAAKEKDSTLRTMNEETSLFLRNGPRAAEPVRELPKKAEPPRRTQAEKERDLALQQLEFRRNVEEAMKQILSFSPSIRTRQEVPVAPVEASVADVDPATLSAQDRLLASALGGGSSVRSVALAREFQEVPKQETVSIDRRVQPPTRFEPTAEDDDGKPVRVGRSGDNGGTDFPVISMRRNSQKVLPSHVTTLPALRDDIVPGAPISSTTTYNLIPGLPPIVVPPRGHR